MKSMLAYSVGGLRTSGNFFFDPSLFSSSESRDAYNWKIGCSWEKRKTGCLRIRMMMISFISLVNRWVDSYAKVQKNLFACHCNPYDFRCLPGRSIFTTNFMTTLCLASPVISPWIHRKIIHDVITAKLVNLVQSIVFINQTTTIMKDMANILTQYILFRLELRVILWNQYKTALRTSASPFLLFCGARSSTVPT